MDPHTLWIIALSIATPVAGVVGFAIQLRAVKKGRLENEKLQLEIEALRAKAEASEKRIVQVTTAEVKRFATRDGVMFSRSSGIDSAEETDLTPAPKTTLKDIAINGAFIASFLLLAAYFLYDIYRFIAWLGTKL